MMKMIDVHSHILPAIDDGSRNVETSQKMLEMSAAQGVELICATPHFYASRDRVDEFLRRREASYERLQLALTAIKAESNREESSGENSERSGKVNQEEASGMHSEKSTEVSSVEYPKILLGAEVAFFQGISRAERITDLVLEGTNLLLLEMPFSTWNDSDLQEVDELMSKRGLRVIIAHLERFLKLPGNKPYVKKLLEMPVLVQINAESLTDRKSRRMVLKLFRTGKAQLLGSDCHGVNHRIPNLYEGRRVLESKLGSVFLEKLDLEASSLFSPLA